MRNIVVKPPLHLQYEDTLLESSLEQKAGDQCYPGDAIASANWLYKSPGTPGPLNALSANFLDLSELIDLDCKLPILWLRGDNDSIISDYSLSDSAVLGSSSGR